MWIQDHIKERHHGKNKIIEIIVQAEHSAKDEIPGGQKLSWISQRGKKTAKKSGFQQITIQLTHAWDLQLMEENWKYKENNFKED